MKASKVAIVVASVVGVAAVGYIIYRVFAPSDSSEGGAPVTPTPAGTSGSGAGTVASLVTRAAQTTAAQAAATSGKPPPVAPASRDNIKASGGDGGPLSNVYLFDSKAWYKT